MARMRMIKPGFFTNDLLGEIEPLGRLLFIGLWCLADREGRLEDRPRKIKAELLPYDNADADALLTGLARQGFIIRYEANGQRCIQVVNFVKHQQPHYKEVASIIPAPPGHQDSGTTPGGVPEAQRQRIMERDGWRCVECGSTDQLSIDHIVPRSLGGSHDDDNLRTLCLPCNTRKGNRIAASSSVQGQTEIEPNSNEARPDLAIRNSYSNGNQIHGQNQNHHHPVSAGEAPTPVAADADVSPPAAGDDDAGPLPANAPAQSQSRGHKSKNALPDDHPAVSLARHLRTRILENLPTAKLPPDTNLGMQSWASVIEIMLRRDGRARDAIERVIDFAQGDSFWSTNILSANSLRQQYDRLEMQRQRKGQGNHGANGRRAAANGRGYPEPTDEYYEQVARRTSTPQEW